MAISGKKKKQTPHASAIHGTDGETHIVGIGNIRVIICPDGEGWFAQGLEIDYAAGGRTVAEVKKNFEKGLKGTIALHLQMYGNIDKFLKFAPQAAWNELYQSGRHFRYSQVSFHDDISKALMYQGINYLEPAPEVAA